MKSKTITVCLFLCFYMTSYSQSPERVLVISGGGERGAWGAGLITSLLKDSLVNYKAIFGTSTGSLMAPLIAVADTGNLHKAYTTARQHDIFNVNPFKKNGDLKKLPAIIRIIGGVEKYRRNIRPAKKNIKIFYTRHLAAFTRTRQIRLCINRKPYPK